MYLLSSRSLVLICTSFSFLAQGLTIPNEQREALGLPLVNYTPPEDTYELFKSDNLADDQPRSEHHVVLEARRGRGGSRPSRPKHSRKPRPSNTKKTRSTPKPTHSKSVKPTSQSASKPTSKSASKPISKSTKNVWPTPAVSRPTTAIDPCDLFIDCSNDNAAMQDVGVMAKRAGNYAIDMHITDAPVPTESATIDHHDKRDIRTQKPKLGTAGTLTIKNLDYPGSGKLFGGSKPARHAFQFNDNSIKDARVKDLGKAPTNTVDFATEHIVELQTLGDFLETVAKKNNALARFLLGNWNAKLTPKQLGARTNKPSYGLNTLPPTGGTGTTVNNLVFNAFGSNTQLEDFVLCDDKINSYKARVWGGKAPMSAANFKTLLTKSMDGKLPSNVYLTALKMTFGVFEYMDQTVVTQNMRRVIDNVGKELANVQLMFDKTVLPTNVAATSVFPKGADLQAEWTKYMKNHLTTISTKAQAWANTGITYASTELKKEIISLERTMKKLQALEQKATPAYKKQRQALLKKLTTQIAKHKQEVAVITKRIALLENQRKTASTPALTKQIKAQKKAWQGKVEALAGAERQRAVLYSTGIKKVIDGLKQDEIILKGYKALIHSDLVMPAP